MKQNQCEQNFEKQISFQFENSFVLGQQTSREFSNEAPAKAAGDQKSGSFQKLCVETNPQASAANLNQISCEKSSDSDQIESVLDNGTSKIFKQSHPTQTDLDRQNRIFQLAHAIQIEKASQNNTLDFSISEPKKTQDFKNQNSCLSSLNQRHSSKTQDLLLKPSDQSSSSSDDLTRKSLAQLSGEAVLQSFHKIVQSERKIMHLVLLHIQEIDSRKLYLAHASSLFEYLTQVAGYAEGAAYDRIQAARLLNKHPQIVQKIEDGAINLSQLVQLSSCLKKESKEGRSVPSEITQQILEKVQKKSLFETKKILSQEFHLTPCYVQKITPQRDESVQMQITLSQDQYALLQKAMSLISHSVPDQSLADGIAYLAKVYVQKIEGKSQKSEPLSKLNLKQDCCQSRMAEGLKQEISQLNIEVSPKQELLRSNTEVSLKQEISQTNLDQSLSSQSLKNQKQGLVLNWPHQPHTKTALNSSDQSENSTQENQNLKQVTFTDFNPPPLKSQNTNLQAQNKSKTNAPTHVIQNQNTQKFLSNRKLLTVTSNLSASKIHLSARPCQESKASFPKTHLSTKFCQESKPSFPKTAPKSLTQSFWNNQFCKTPRAYICVRTKREIYARAENSCQYIHPQSQQKCGSRYQLQIDHITPLALGGSNSSKNLRLLCAAHNRSEAVRLGL